MAWEPIRIFQITMGAASTFTSNVDLKSYYKNINLVVESWIIFTKNKDTLKYQIIYAFYGRFGL